MFKVNNEDISDVIDVVVVYLLLTLSIFHFLFWLFLYYLWVSKCFLELNLSGKLKTTSSLVKSSEHNFKGTGENRSDQVFEGIAGWLFSAKCSANFHSICIANISYYIHELRALHADKSLLNPLSANPTKWSNTLKQFVGKLPKNCLSVFDHFVGLALKGLNSFEGSRPKV